MNCHFTVHLNLKPTSAFVAFFHSNVIHLKDEKLLYSVNFDIRTLYESLKHDLNIAHLWYVSSKARYDLGITSRLPSSHEELI